MRVSIPKYMTDCPSWWVNIINSLAENRFASEQDVKKFFQENYKANISGDWSQSIIEIEFKDEHHYLMCVLKWL